MRNGAHNKSKRKEGLMQEFIEIMESKVELFNQKHPIGSKVTVVKDLGEKFETKVRYPAEILSGHTAVVWLEGISGCYCLDRVMA